MSSDVINFPATGVPAQLRRAADDPAQRQWLTLTVSEWEDSFSVSACWSSPMSIDAQSWWRGPVFDNLGGALHEAARLSALLGGIWIEVHSKGGGAAPTRGDPGHG